MDFSSDYVYAIRDKKSGKFLNSIWLSENNVRSLFSDIESAQKRIDRLKMGKYTSKGYLKYQVENLEIVKLKLTVCEEN